MAVYQIAKIQLRRGRKNTGSGIPQLASGEMAWAIDSQELYIGNGAVSEGSPAVGNTKVLTEHDNLFDLIGNYQYAESNSAISTSTDPNNPILVPLSSVLDQLVNAEFFGINGNGVADNSVALQHAIDQLFLNDLTKTLVDSRVELVFDPGVYNFSQTVYLPPYVSIRGHGIQKTIFNYSGTGAAFEFVNDSSTPGNYSVIGSTTYENQPRFAKLRDFTVVVSDANASGLILNAVRDSLFENIELQGAWSILQDEVIDNIGLKLNVLSSMTTTQRNLFKNIEIRNFSTGLYAKQDIISNQFDSCIFTTLDTGISFGVGADGFTTGEIYGPRKNSIKNSLFEIIKKHGIYIDKGNGNKSRSNTFINVGNNASGNASNLYNQISFNSQGNSSIQDNFDRADDLATAAWSSSYIKEIGGISYQQLAEPRKVNIGFAAIASEAFRIPLSNATAYEINYMHESSVYQQMRKGKLNIAVDLARSQLLIVDEYEYAGVAGSEENLSFSGSIVNNNLVIYYTNINPNDSSSITYVYNVLN